MGTPNNPQSQELRTVIDILGKIARDPEHKITAVDALTTGVDVCILEATYETDIRPQLDYLHGYEQIEKLDGWGEAILRYNQLKQYQRVLQVFGSRVYFYEETSGQSANRFRDLEIQVGLTRKGIWLLRYKDFGLPGYTTSVPQGLQIEHFSTHKGVKTLCNELQSVTTQNSVTLTLRGRRVESTLPLGIEDGLRRILQSTIGEREKRLKDMKRSLEDAENRVSIVQ